MAYSCVFFFFFLVNDISLLIYLEHFKTIECVWQIMLGQRQDNAEIFGGFLFESTRAGEKSD